MKNRFILSLTLLLTTALLCSTALAGTDLRRVTLHDGTVVTGTVIERGDGYLVIKGEDGVAQELRTADISVVEVLAGEDKPQVEGNEDLDMSIDEGDAEEQVEGIADRLSGLAPSDLRRRYRSATLAHGLSVAPSVPMMLTGMFFTGTLASIFVYEGEARIGLGTVGVLLSSGSIGTAAAGALLGRRAVGDNRSMKMFNLGLGFAIAGNTVFHLSAAILHGYEDGSINNEALLIGAFPLVFTGMGFLIAGEVILMADAQISKDGIKEQMRRQRRKRRCSSTRAPAPTFAGAWFSPLPGGAGGGLSLRF